MNFIVIRFARRRFAISAGAEESRRVAKNGEKCRGGPRSAVEHPPPNRAGTLYGTKRRSYGIFSNFSERFGRNEIDRFRSEDSRLCVTLGDSAVELLIIRKSQDVFYPIDTNSKHFFSILNEE